MIPEDHLPNNTGSDLYYLIQGDMLMQGGGTSPAGPAKAGPFFHRGSNIFEQIKKTNQ